MGTDSCITVKKIKDGETAFERKRYAQAITLLENEYKNTENKAVKAHKAYYIGESHRRIGQIEEAILWYKRAAELDYGVEALAQYGYTLKQIGEYDMAAKVFRYLQQEYPADQRVRRELASLEIIKSWNAQEKYRGIELKNLDLNTSTSEYFPRKLGVDQLLFISDRAASTGEKEYAWTGRAFSDLYVYDMKNRSVSKYEKVSQGDFNDGMVAMDSSGNTVIYTRCGKNHTEASYRDEYCQLFQLKNPQTFYSESTKLPFVKEGFNYLHPCLNAAGNLLIFSGFLPDGVGGYDLWYSQKIDGQWQKPRLLSSRINTRGDELFPSLYGDTLYFSSDYLTGYGGLDIFKTYLKSDGTWAPPENLKSPINSGADELGFVPGYAYANAHKLDFAGYFSSNRPGGKGGDDLYFFTQKNMVPPQDSTERAEEEIVKLRLLIRVKKKRFNIANIPASGLDTLLNLTTAIIEVKDQSDKDNALHVNNLGSVKVDIDTSVTYEIKVSAENYLTKSFKFDPKGKILPDRKVTTVYKEVVLDSIITNVEIVLNNIYYDFDKWNIRKDAEPTLDTLVTLLKDNPELAIELNSHTDCRGSDMYNQTLSQKRAQSVVDYLIAHGIRKDRLTAIGYGETRPVVDCRCAECTDTQHQKNRRTSFTIVE